MSATSKYTGADIVVLEGLEPVRKRPGMYIGTVDKKGLHHLVWEIVDNAVDEYINGFGDSVTVTLSKSGDGVSVADNGRGIPVDNHPTHKKPTLEIILTTLHSGAKFGDGDSYIHSGGLHGVGSSVVNALSRKLVATVRRDGGSWEQSFARGKPTSTLRNLGASRGHGTTIYFEPDPDIFKTTHHFDPEWIRAHLEDMSYIHSGLKVIFQNQVTGETLDLSHAGGIPEFLTRIVTEGKKEPVSEAAFTLARKEGERIEVALQWTQAGDEDIRSYVNGIRTRNGGTHEKGLKSAVVKAIRNFMTTHDVKIKGLEITAEDIREGLVGILSVFLREPMFTSQTKEELTTGEMNSAVANFVGPGLESWLNTNKSGAADQIVGRIITAARARQASRDAATEVKRKSVTQRRLNLPGKLADCKSTSLDETELFIVEGDSAGGSAKQGRDNRTQAVLALKGKILNTEGLALNKVLTNAELKDLVSALGTGAGEKCDLSSLRYGKLILLMDADADGYHITTLMLAFLFRHMIDLIKKGHVYIAQPPLFRIKVGTDFHWARDEEHRDQIVAGLRANAKYEVSRFKGLGEMDAKELKDTTLDPRNRTLLKVEIGSMLDTDKTFVDLLGKDPSQRTRLILDAQLSDVEELDV